MLLSIPLTLLGEFGGASTGLMFLLMWAYTIVQEACWGRTTGKRVMSLRVVAQTARRSAGWPPSPATCCAPWTCCRSVMRWGCCRACSTATAGARATRVAGTVVVHDSGRPWSASVAIDTVLAPPQPLQPAEQAAIIAFAERAPRLSGPRQQELAAVAAPISGGGAVGVLRLYAMANWLLGRR